MGRQPGLETAVVKKAQSGDERARRTLFETLEPVLRAFFVSRIGRKSEVDDLVQNTFVRMYRGLEDLKDPRRLKSFTMKAALFELQDYYRGRYGPKESILDPDSLPELRADGSADAVFDVDRALAALNPKARRIIELREYGYQYREIARMVGTTEAAVKMQVKRAFEKMRRALVSLLLVLLTL